MKIGFVFDDSLDKTDGVQQYLSSLGGWFRSQGHEVHYLVGETKRTDMANVHSLSRNINVRFNGNRLSIPLTARRSRIRALLRSQNFDVLHVQVPYSPWLAGRVIGLADSRTVVFGTFHIAPYSKLVTLATRLLAIWSWRSIRRFNEVVAVSPVASQFARDTYGITTDIVPNVIDYERYNTAQPLSQYEDDVVTILFLGRLVERKGCMRLLQAIEYMQRSGAKLPNYRVIICGGGPLDASLREFVRAHQLGRLVSFVGRVSEADKPRYYASADISVFPSSGGESFGIVLLEAMASGKSVVLGGNNLGYQSVLGPRPELLFAPSDIAELSRKITHFSKDTEARKAGAQWGMAEAQRYDVGQVGQQLLKKYMNIAKNSRNEQ